MRSKSILNINQDFRSLFSDLRDKFGENPQAEVTMTQMGGTATSTIVSLSLFSSNVDILFWVHVLLVIE